MIPLIIAYILNIADYIFTARWIRKFGVEIEANPLARWMFTHNVAWVFKILIVGGLFAVLGYCIFKHPKAAWIGYIPLGVYALLTIYHIFLCIKIGRVR